MELYGKQVIDLEFDNLDIVQFTTHDSDELSHLEGSRN